MTSPTRRFAACAAVAVVLLAAGCSGGKDGRDGNDPSTGDAEPANAGKVSPGEAEPRETLASQDVSTLGTDLHVAVHSLTAGEATAELTFSVTNTGEEESDRLSVTFARHNEYDLSGVELIDTANGRVHLPATNESDECVCSAGLNAVRLAPDDSVLFSATYGAPPEGVGAMSVRIPTVGTFDNVPLG